MARKFVTTHYARKAYHCSLIASNGQVVVTIDNDDPGNSCEVGTRAATRNTRTATAEDHT
jgi:hypothetical protein